MAMYSGTLHLWSCCFWTVVATVSFDIRCTIIHTKMPSALAYMAYKWSVSEPMQFHVLGNSCLNALNILKGLTTITFMVLQSAWPVTISIYSCESNNWYAEINMWNRQVHNFNKIRPTTNLCKTVHCISDTFLIVWSSMVSQIAKFMGPTRGAPRSYRPQMGPILAPWNLLSGILVKLYTLYMCAC